MTVAWIIVVSSSLLLMQTGRITLGSDHNHEHVQELHAGRRQLERERVERKTFKGRAASGTRIYNGTEIRPHEFPELVRVYNYKAELNSNSTCTATILSRNYILTTVSCVLGSISNVPLDLSDLRVVAGDHNNSVRERSEQRVSIVDILIHNRFNTSSVTEFDIAVARIEPPFNFNARVRPVNLPGCKEKFPTGETYTVVGFGQFINENEAFLDSEVPHKTQVRWISHDDCEQRYGEGYFPLSRKTLCTEPLQPDGPRPCFGDEGGPLFRYNEAGVPIQIGLGATIGIGGFEYCTDNNFTIYTDLTYYVGWIHRRISGCGNFPAHPQYFVGNTGYTMRPSRPPPSPITDPPKKRVKNK